VNTAISKSLAIIVNDPDATGGGGFVHGSTLNVELAKMNPKASQKIPEVTFLITTLQEKNSFGNIGYNSPCPPRGKTHRYFFKGYGLDCQLSHPAE
jgi:hypothetical protein